MSFTIYQSLPCTKKITPSEVMFNIIQHSKKVKEKKTCFVQIYANHKEVFFSRSPVCSWSEGCPAPAGTCVDLYPADSLHPSASWWWVQAPRTLGTLEQLYCPPPGSDWLGLAWWLAVACLSTLTKRERRTVFTRFIPTVGAFFHLHLLVW